MVLLLCVTLRTIEPLLAWSSFVTIDPVVQIKNSTYSKVTGWTPGHLGYACYECRLFREVFVSNDSATYHILTLFTGTQRRQRLLYSIKPSNRRACVVEPGLHI